TPLLEELVSLDIGYRCRLGETPRAEDYLSRFPDLDAAWLESALAAAARPGGRQSAVGGGRGLGTFPTLERVGQGAFGEVWRARDTELDRIVALKRPHPGLVDAPEHRERFLREARAAAQLRHPGIVPVFEAAELDGRPAIISEYIDGASLRDVLRQRRP